MNKIDHSKTKLTQLNSLFYTIDNKNIYLKHTFQLGTSIEISDVK